MANYSFPTGKKLPKVDNGHFFDGCNFHQLTPHTKIFEGVTGLTFRHCNLINCDLPADAKLVGSNNCQVEHCSNLHPRWTEFGLPICPANCTHVVDIDQIQDGGVTVQTVYHYSDRNVE